MKSWEFVLRKPLGLLVAAALASVAIPVALAPAAMAAAPALTTLSSDKVFKDNAATGIDLPNGTGLLRIASSTGLPTNITSADFDVIATAYQAEEDGRFWDITVKLKAGHSFKAGISASWHCPGHGSKGGKPSTSPKSSEPSESTAPAAPVGDDSAPTTDEVAPTAAPTETSAPAPGSGDVIGAPVQAAPAGGSTPQVPFTPAGGVDTGFGFLAS
jgi:hypothetical protein